jgi:hypothetical protein
LDRGSAHRKASTYTQNKHTQSSMPRVEFEPMIPVIEQAKTVHALGHAATVIGTWDISLSCNLYVNDVNILDENTDTTKMQKLCSTRGLLSTVAQWPGSDPSKAP